MRLLLINPKFPESFWSFKWAISEILPGKRAVNPPLGLATVAALCPADWQVQIIDENVESVPLAPAADIIGICGMRVQLARQRELLAYYRNHGYYVVAGGSYASLCPEDYALLADTVVAGEAEHIWKEFCQDFERNAPKPLYQERGIVALTDSPVPRFDLLKLDRYTSATIQFSRGCPFRCEFCDIVVMFGRKPRVKSPEQIGRELDDLRRLGMHSVFFVDDNLIGDRRRAKEMLRFLKSYQEEHHYPFSFGTEVSLNLAQDEELLSLFRDANFGWVFIGIESPDPASLKEAHKTQNLREDALSSVRRIYGYGIDVLGGFIIGFDSDTAATFDNQYRFITAAGIQSAMVGLLTAIPRTPLYERMKREGRLREVPETADNTRPMTNIVPKSMSDDAMAAGYRKLYRELFTSAAIASRIRNKMRYLRAPQHYREYSALQRTRIFMRLLCKGIIPGGVAQTMRFFGSLAVASPSRIALVISDWVVGLSMREFARRCLGADASVSTALDRRAASLCAAIGDRLAQGKVTLTWRQAAVPNLVISLNGMVDRHFSRFAVPRLRRLLKHTSISLTLRIGSLPPSQLEEIKRLLRRLSRYGDRISIAADETLREILAVNSSVFNLRLGPPSP